MKLIPSLCMMIRHLWYHCQLSTNCQIVRYLQCIASQAADCELDTIWTRDFNARSYNFQLSTYTWILGDSQWVANQATVCELNAIWLRDSNSQSLLLSIVHTITYSRILAMHRKPSSCLWAGYNMDKRFQCQILWFSIVHIYLNSWRLTTGRKPSHRLWAEYNMTERFQSWSLTVVSCPYNNIFSDTRNASQAKQLFMSWIQYG